jgi:hypothetical protein
MLRHRFVSFAVVFAVLVGLFVAIGPASAADSIFVDFEKYAPGTPLSEVNEAGVSIQPGPGSVISLVAPGGPLGNFLITFFDAASSSLTLSFSSRASEIAFDYSPLPFQTTTATFYREGAVVDTFTLAELAIAGVMPFFSFSYEGSFDKVTIDFTGKRLFTEVRGGSVPRPPLGLMLDNIDVTLETYTLPVRPDDRLNWGYCDLDAVIYQRTGPDGTPALHVYGVDGDSNGHFLLDVTGPDLAPYVAEPPQGQNVLIEEAGNVQLYALISGEFSLHIHMDDYGNVCAWVFDGLPPVNTHVVNYNMYQ